MTACRKECVALRATGASGCILRPPLRRGASVLVSCTSGCSAPLIDGEADTCRNRQLVAQVMMLGDYTDGE